MPSLDRGYNRLILSLFSLDRDCLERVSHRSFGYDDFSVIMHRKRAFAPLKELLSVKVNDQHVSGRPEGLIVMLRHSLLFSGESIPQRSRPSCFPLIVKGENLQKMKRNYK